MGNSHTKRKARSNLKVIFAVATLLSALTFLPETVRNDLLTIIKELGSTENIQFVVGGVLLVAIAYVSSRVENNNFLSPIAVRRGFSSKNN